MAWRANVVAVAMKQPKILGVLGLLLASLGSLAGPGSARLAAPQPVPGPGAVWAAVQQFLALQDAGGDAASLLLDGAGGVDFAIDGEGHPVEPAQGTATAVFCDVAADGAVLAESRAQGFARRLQRDVATDAGAARQLRTHVQRFRADCNSPSCSWAVVEFERVYQGAAGERRVAMRATALLQYREGATPGFGIFQWHAARAEAAQADGPKAAK